MPKFLTNWYLYITGCLAGAANGLFGSGGGIITVPMLEHDKTSQAQTQAKKAHATSIAITLPLSIISGFIYFSNGSIDIKNALKYVPFGLLGVAVGAMVLRKIPNKWLKKIFAIVMIFFGLRMIWR